MMHVACPWHLATYMSIVLDCRYQVNFIIIIIFLLYIIKSFIIKVSRKGCPLSSERTTVYWMSITVFSAFIQM